MCICIKLCTVPCNMYFVCIDEYILKQTFVVIIRYIVNGREVMIITMYSLYPYSCTGGKKISVKLKVT